VFCKYGSNDERVWKSVLIIVNKFQETFAFL